MAKEELTLRDFRSMGGKARWEGKSKKERTDHAKMMVTKREEKKKKP